MNNELESLASKRTLSETEAARIISSGTEHLQPRRSALFASDGPRFDRARVHLLARKILRERRDKEGETEECRLPLPKYSHPPQMCVPD